MCKWDQTSARSNDSAKIKWEDDTVNDLKVMKVKQLGKTCVEKEIFVQKVKILKDNKSS